MQENHVVIIGAGPAGLTAAYLLSKQGIAVSVIEADPTYVGGIAKTVKYNNFCFDIGGHRFFSKSEEIEKLWSEILPNDMLIRPRLSRIYYRGKFFSYPLKALDALFKLGVWESLLCILSYVKARLFPKRNPKNFAEWVINHFGFRLYNIFFKSYTEKVWGIRCEEISADWAAQRIKGLSLTTAILNALRPRVKRRNKPTIKTLIDSFRYPRKGPGMLWEACVDKIIANSGKIFMGHQLNHCEFNQAKQQWEVYIANNKNERLCLYATHIISSAPLRNVVLDYLPGVFSNETKSAAEKLNYRDFLIVVLILREKNQFTDNWIYVHDAKVDVARIQNFKSWSPEMVPDPSKCCYGLEYFCFKDDNLWSAPDSVLIQKASKELIQLGLAEEADILDGCVVRQPKAYPVYDQDYQTHVATIRNELSQLQHFYVVGRNGMHKYNNQDHAMMTAILTVKNILQNRQAFDIWQVNQDAEYLESGTVNEQTELGLRQVPRQI